MTLLSDDAYLREPVKTKRAWADCHGFTDASARVVEQQQEGAIALGVARLTLHRDDETGLVRFEVRDGSLRRAFRADFQDPTILLGARQVVTEQMAHEAPDRHQTAIARRHGICLAGPRHAGGTRAPRRR
jgi:hypothetical protein